MKKDVLISIGITLIILLVISYYPKAEINKIDETGAIHELEHVVPLNLEYGIAVDSFETIEGKIKRNQNLSALLIKHGVSPKTIDKISKSTDEFDVRKMRSGNKYKLFFTQEDSLPEAAYFAYEHTAIDYVLVTLQDSITVTMHEKPTRVITKMASGTIESNLWDAMVSNDINPMMSIELSEMYAWSIDFFGLKKGDQFYVVYEERYLDTTSVGIEHIHAALFNHQNKDFYAIYFTQDEQGSFFDHEGNSLRRAFLKAPLKYSRISSRFTKNRFHPVLKIYRPHSGIDYAAPAGTPVYSVGDGFVAKKGYQKKGAGYFIKIKHNSVYTTQYAHLKSFAKGLKTGDPITQGQLIGYVGSTGYSTGPHLDFRFFKNGEAVDPLKVDAPPVEPVKKVNREEFERIKSQYMFLLDNQRQELLMPDTLIAQVLR